MNIAKFIFVALVLFSSVVRAESGGGVDVSGGGGGVAEGQNVYLLDLFEMAAHKTPFFLNREPDQNFLRALRESANTVGLPALELATKLRDLETLDPVFTAATLEAILRMNWVFVDFELSDTADHNSTIIANKRILQLATRQGSVVRIQKSLWLRLDQNNRTALVLHEAIAAFRDYTKMTPAGIRRILGLLFMENIYRETSEDFVRSLFKGLPNKWLFLNKLPEGAYGTYIKRDFSDESLLGPRISPKGRMRVAGPAHFYFQPSVFGEYKSAKKKSRRTQAEVTAPFLRYTQLGTDSWQPTFLICGNVDYASKLEVINLISWVVRVEATPAENGTMLPTLKASIAPILNKQIKFNQEGWTGSECSGSTRESLVEIDHLNTRALRF